MSYGSDPDLQAAIAVTRFGLGARPGDIAAARSDPQGWLEAQVASQGADIPVAPGGQPLPDTRDRFQALLAYRAARQAAGQDMMARKAAAEPLNEALDNEILSRAWLGATAPASFRERWALFWGNHFSVSTKKGEELHATAAAFEREAIRPRVFGRFEDLLVASSGHPAMIMYLDQQNSIGPNSPAAIRQRLNGKAPGLNENLGREIMELHSLGADAGYSQADVTEFARALTGWSFGGGGVPIEQQGAFLYKPQVHEPGPRQVFGAAYPSGEFEQARAALRDFARSPHTSRHVARKLAAHFVADTPPPALVARLDAAYRESDGDLSHVARTLVRAPEAWSPQAAKLKTPYEFVISSYRIAGYGPGDPRKDVLGPLGGMGHRPLAAAQPNGWSDAAADWAAPDAIVKRISFAQGLANAHAPQAEPLQLADAALGARLGPATAAAIRRAESRPEAFTLLLMSPEFQRR